MDFHSAHLLFLFRLIKTHNHLLGSNTSLSFHNFCVCVFLSTCIILIIEFMDVLQICWLTFSLMSRDESIFGLSRMYTLEPADVLSVLSSSEPVASVHCTFQKTSFILSLYQNFTVLFLLFISLCFMFQIHC